MINFVTSIKDPVVEQARSLATPKGRRVAHKCLLESIEQIEWAMAEGLHIDYVFFESKELEHLLIKKLTSQGIVCYSTSEGILKKISETSYLITFIGVAQLLPEADFDSTGNDFVVVLDHLKDHGNIGAIVRSAHAFGIKNVVLTDQATDLFYKKTIDASRGKVFGTTMKTFDASITALHELKKAGYQIVATSSYGSVVQSIAQIRKKPIALIVGNETDGISDEVIKNADYVIQIPMSSDVESLNVAVAAGISIYELKMKLVFAMLQEKIKASLGRNINVAAKMVQQVFDAQTKQLTGLSNLQVILLMILKCDVFMTYEQAGKDTATFGHDRQTLLQPLFDQGLINKIIKDGHDGIELTYKGEEFLAKTWLIHEKGEEEILADFSEEEKQQLDVFLTRIQNNCQKLIEAE